MGLGLKYSELWGQDVLVRDLELAVSGFRVDCFKGEGGSVVAIQSHS